MSASCSVSLRREGQFLVAQVLIASPRGTDHARVNQPYVVTKNGATPVAATEVDATKASNRMAPNWSWTSSGVRRLGSGSSRCGGSGESWGGASPNVEFISVCPS
jgi:hypothetical protein